MQECRHLILATVTAVNDSQIVYPNCTTCYTKLLRDGETNRWWCGRCEEFYVNDKLEWRFRLSLTITDGSTLSSVCGFGTNLQQYFGMTAEKFKQYLDHVELSSKHVNMEQIILKSLKQTFVGQCFYFGFKTTSKYGTSLKDIRKTTSGSGKMQHGKEKASHIAVYQIIPSTTLEFYTVFDAINDILKSEKLDGFEQSEQPPFCADFLNMKKLHSPEFTTINNRRDEICNSSSDITHLSAGSFGQETALLSCDLSSNASNICGVATPSEVRDRSQNNAGSFLKNTREHHGKRDISSVNTLEATNLFSNAGEKFHTKSQTAKENSRDCCPKYKNDTKSCTSVPCESDVCWHGNQTAEVCDTENCVNTVTDQLDLGSESWHSDISPPFLTPPPKQDLFSTSLNNSSLLLACEDCEEQATQVISFCVKDNLKKPEVQLMAPQSIVKEISNTTIKRCDNEFDASERRVAGYEEIPVTYGNHPEMIMSVHVNKENFVRQNSKNFIKSDNFPIENKNVMNTIASVHANFHKDNSTCSHIRVEEKSIHESNVLNDENIDLRKDGIDKQITMFPESEDIYAYLDVDDSIDFDGFSVKETSILLPNHTSQGIGTHSPTIVTEKPRESETQNMLSDSQYNTTNRPSIVSFQKEILTDHLHQNQNDTLPSCTGISRKSQDEPEHIKCLNMTNHSNCWSEDLYSLDIAITDSQIVGEGTVEAFNFLSQKDNNINNIQSDSNFVLKETKKTDSENCKIAKHGIEKTLSFSSVRKGLTDTKPEACNLDMPEADGAAADNLDMVARNTSESDSGLTLTNEKVSPNMKGFKSLKMLDDRVMKTPDVISLQSSDSVDVRSCEQGDLLPEIFSEEMFTNYRSYSLNNDQETVKEIINIPKVKTLSPIATKPADTNSSSNINIPKVKTLSPIVTKPADTNSSSICDIVHESYITESVMFDNSGDLFSCTGNCDEDTGVCNSVLSQTRNHRGQTSSDVQNGKLLYSAIPRVKGVQFAKRLSCIKTVPLIDIEMRINKCARLLSGKSLKVPKSCLKKRKSIVASENLLIHATPIFKNSPTCISQDLFISQPSCNRITPDTTSMSQNLFTPSPGSNLSCVDYLIKSSSCNVKRNIKFIFPTRKVISKTMASTPKCESVAYSSSQDLDLHSSPLSQTGGSVSVSLFADSFDDIIAGVSSQVENVTSRTECAEPQRGCNGQENSDSIYLKRKMSTIDVNSPDLFGDSLMKGHDFTDQDPSLHDLPVKRLFLD